MQEIVATDWSPNGYSGTFQTQSHCCDSCSKLHRTSEWKMCTAACILDLPAKGVAHRNRGGASDCARRPPPGGPQLCEIIGVCGITSYQHLVDTADRTAFLAFFPALWL